MKSSQNMLKNYVLKHIFSSSAIVKCIVKIKKAGLLPYHKDTTKVSLIICVPGYSYSIIPPSLLPAGFPL